MNVMTKLGILALVFTTFPGLLTAGLTPVKVLSQKITSSTIPISAGTLSLKWRYTYKIGYTAEESIAGKFRDGFILTWKELPKILEAYKGSKLETYGWKGDYNTYENLLEAFKTAGGVLRTEVAVAKVEKVIWDGSSAKGCKQVEEEMVWLPLDADNETIVSHTETKTTKELDPSACKDEFKTAGDYEKCDGKTPFKFCVKCKGKDLTRKCS